MDHWFGCTSEPIHFEALVNSPERFEKKADDIL